jgi:hypothetical protein
VLTLCGLGDTSAGAQEAAPPPLNASNGCSVSSAPEAQTFGPLGDQSWYVEAPNGGFENGSAGWTLSPGASVQSGANQTLLPAAGDDHGLVLPPLASATTGVFCVTGTAPTMRLFARQSSWLPSAIVVTVVATRPGSLPQLLATPTLAVPGSWTSPTELFRLPWLGDANTQVTITIASVGLGTVQIDDVYVDPIRQR